MNQIIEKETGLVLPEIDFGCALYTEDEGNGAVVLSYADVKKEDFLSYIGLLQKADFAQKETYRINDAIFYTLTQGNSAVYASFYPGISEMRLVAEKDSAYLSFYDEPGLPITTSLISQLHVQDFGLSDVFRLADGRFVVVDGGWYFEPDAKNLMQVLREQSPFEKPIIAAWIMTHPHIDHYRCYLTFDDLYHGEYTVQNFLYNFPDKKEGLFEQVPDYNEESEITYLPKFYERVKQSGAKVYKVHTGQIYDFSNLHIEMLSTPDDVFFAPIVTTNKISLIMKWVAEGETILLTGDTDMETSKMAGRYGSYLKSDIFQIPHHGFNGGSIESNCLIDPSICLIPSFEVDFYRGISIYDPVYQHLIFNSNVAEMYTGTGGNVTLPIPYYPNPQNRQLLLDTVEKHQRSMGAKSWFFSDMMWEDCQFTILNVGRTVDVFANLMFDDGTLNVHAVKLVAKGGMTRIDFNNPEDIDGDALFFNRSSLKIKGVDKQKPFSLHFSSKYPVVIVGKKPADYKY